MKRALITVALSAFAVIAIPLEDLNQLERDVMAIKNRVERNLDDSDAMLDVFARGDGEGSDSAGTLKEFMKGTWLDARKAWASEKGRAAITSIGMEGLVNCPIVPSSGEELARQNEYLGRHLMSINPSSDPTASLRQQATFALLTEGMGDAVSTCGYLPNFAMALSGYRGSNCAAQSVPLFKDKSSLKKCDVESQTCECAVPTFNRQYNVKASDDNSKAPTPYDWIKGDEKFGKKIFAKVKTNKGVKAPVSQGNFKSMMTTATWTTPKDRNTVPKPGDLYFIVDPAKTKSPKDTGNEKTGAPEAGHVGIVLTVSSEDPFKMGTADAGQACGSAKSASDKAKYGKGFSSSGWQCIGKNEGGRAFKKITSAAGSERWMVEAYGRKRELAGWIDVRGLVPDDKKDREKVFDPATRWTTKEFCDIIYKDGKATDVVPPSIKSTGEAGKTTGDA